jgi:hypothetical protein
MVDITDEEIAAAEERGRIADDLEPRATAVHYDRTTGLIVLQLKHAAVFSVPARLLQGLEAATDDEISEVGIIGRGYGLEWEKLDLHHAVPALVAGHYGTSRYMAGLLARGTIRAFGDDTTQLRSQQKRAAS